MKFNKNPGSFLVQEIMKPNLGEGKYFYYILEKRGIDSASAAAQLEKENETNVSYSGLKDAAATTRQWISSEKELRSSDDRIKLEFKGMGKKGIFVGMHSANRFTVKLTDVSPQEAEMLKKELKKIVFPNYFDEQRFNEKTLSLGQALREKDWEKAVKLALTQKLGVESEKSLKIKSAIEKNWGNWEKLAKDESIPQSKKQIFELLLEKNDFHGATELLERKTVAIGCRAMQAEEFNSELAEKITKQNARDQKCVGISGREYPIKFSLKGIAREIKIPAIYPKKVVLDRKTYFEAENIKVNLDDKEATLKFDLKKGSYATILLKCIEQLF